MQIWYAYDRIKQGYVELYILKLFYGKRKDMKNGKKFNVINGFI